MFDPTSRYAKVEEALLETTDADGDLQRIRYKRRRFIPSREGSILLFSHVVREGERIDRIAAAYLGDPAQYHQLCDENGAMNPTDLVAEPGQSLRIAMPKV